MGAARRPAAGDRGRREALEIPERDAQLRKRLTRELDLRSELVRTLVNDGRRAVVDYFWALFYLSLQVHQSGTPEGGIVEGARVDVAKLLTVGTDYQDLTLTTSADQIDYCREQLGDRVDWVRTYPVLRAVPPLVLGKNDVQASLA
jgi:hypothetical protein